MATRSLEEGTSDPRPVLPSRADRALRELGGFLRHRRERPAPATRRPGARARGATREEIAAEADISSDWYARIEQARAPGLTASTLRATCAALALEPIETEYALRLLEASRAEPSAAPPPDPVTVRALVSELRDAPAYVIDERWRILAHNEAATLLHADLDRSGDAARNCLCQHFLNRAFRSALDHEAQVLAYLAALFRHSTAGHAGEAWRTALIEDLAERSEDFTRLWNERGVADWGTAEKSFDHPSAGILRFTNVSHRVGPMDGPQLRIVSYLPIEGSGTREKVAEFVAR